MAEVQHLDQTRRRKKLEKASLVGPVGIEPTTCGLKGSVSLKFGQAVLSSIPQGNFRQHAG